MIATNIKVGDIERPFLFSWKAIKELARTSESEDLDELGETELMAFIGFKHGALKEGKKVDFSQQDIENWIDDDLSLLGFITQAVEEMKAEQEKMKAPLNRQQKRSQKKP